jgi:hypothetical protein
MYIHPHSTTLVTGPVTGPHENGDIREVMEEEVEQMVASGFWAVAGAADIQAYEARQEERRKAAETAAAAEVAAGEAATNPPPPKKKAIAKAEVVEIKGGL